LPLPKKQPLGDHTLLTLRRCEKINRSVVAVLLLDQSRQQLRSAGWSASTTKGSGDQGTDIIATKADLRLVVQCKLYNHPVGNKAVQEIAAARTHEKADWAAVVSNARYTPAAEELAATNGVLLLHHTDLRTIDDLLSV
jgi:restriction system protein